MMTATFSSPHWFSTRATKPNVAPRLASAWRQLDGRHRWRFTIASGAAFHDGSPVRAGDVVWRTAPVA
ncbi:ABC transporter substrate-binding protein [Nocardia concava]|uniref:ABC transporter substrate-binding protein n=1 Tax=Nocardia concava TaxID=257281 RepID=UPI00357150AC